MDIWGKSNQWLLSCYTYTKEAPCLQGGVELLWFLYYYHTVVWGQNFPLSLHFTLYHPRRLPATITLASPPIPPLTHTIYMYMYIV